VNITRRATVNRSVSGKPGRAVQDQDAGDGDGTEHRVFERFHGGLEEYGLS